MYNVVALIKSAFDKNHNHCYCQTFLEKCSYKQHIKYYITIKLMFLKVLILIIFLLIIKNI